jgi:hypothetical protein
MDKIKDMLKGHPDQTNKGVDKGGDFIDDRTQGKYSGQVDTGQDKLRDQYGAGKDDRPPQS